MYADACDAITTLGFINGKGEMISTAHDPALYAQWLERIRSPATQDAFRYLIGAAVCLRGLTCHAQLKGPEGPLHDVRFSDMNSEQHFAFIESRQGPSVLLPGARSSLGSLRLRAAAEPVQLSRRELAGGMERTHQHPRGGDAPVVVSEPQMTLSEPKQFALTSTGDAS